MLICNIQQVIYEPISLKHIILILMILIGKYITRECMIKGWISLFAMKMYTTLIIIGMEIIWNGFNFGIVTYTSGWGGLSVTKFSYLLLTSSLINNNFYIKNFYGNRFNDEKKRVEHGRKLNFLAPLTWWKLIIKNIFAHPHTHTHVAVTAVIFTLYINTSCMSI